MIIKILSEIKKGKEYYYMNVWNEKNGHIRVRSKDIHELEKIQKTKKIIENTQTTLKNNLLTI